MTCTVIPFPLEHCSLLWGWMQQRPTQNTNDHGPQSLEMFERHMAKQRAAGVETFEAVYDGLPVGAIAVARARVSHFAGICFDESVHGKGVAVEAVGHVLENLFAGGSVAVHAHYFEDNAQVHRFLKKLGAVDIENGVPPCRRNGLPLNWKACLITIDNFRKVKGLRSNPVCDSERAEVVRGATG